MREVKFELRAGLVAAIIPEDAYTSNIELLPEQKEKQTEEFLAKGDNLVIAAKGKGCDFVNRNDSVSIAGHTRVEKLFCSETNTQYFIFRESDILTKRRLSDEIATLEDLSKKYKISRERIRQIETKAFEKLQKAMLIAAKSNHLLPKN